MAKLSSYARILFVDFTSAFNTIVPKILLDKLESLDVPFFLRSVIKSFLVDRQQFVRIAEQKSGILHCDIGCPQGCVLSPILFSILLLLHNNSDLFSSKLPLFSLPPPI